MIFKIGLLLVLLLVIGMLEEIRISIESLTRTIRIIKYQEESKDDNKNTTAMQKQEKQ